MNRELIYTTFIELLDILNNKHLQYYFTGGVCARLLSAYLRKEPLSFNCLRDHKDIDILVFEKDFFTFLSCFSRSRYDIIFSGLQAFENGALGEHHHVLITDRTTSGRIGIFVVQETSEHLVIHTNVYTRVISSSVFQGEILKINQKEIPCVRREYLYYNDIFFLDERKEDGQLLFPFCNMDIFNIIQYESYLDLFLKHSYVHFLRKLSRQLTNG